LVLLNYGAALKKSHKDWEARIENINELISFAQTYEDQGTFDNLDQDSSHDPTGNSSTPSSENAQHEAKCGTIILTNKMCLTFHWIRPDLLRSFLERATLSTDILTSEDANIKVDSYTFVLPTTSNWSPTDPESHYCHLPQRERYTISRCITDNSLYC
jgi:hypothetical protein